MLRILSSKGFTKMLPVFVLVVGLTTTFMVWFMLDAGFNHEARHEFSDQSRKIVRHLVERINDHEHLLLGAEGLFSASDVVSREAWRRYVTSLQLQKHHLGILGVGYAAWLTPEEKETHLRNIRREGFLEYRISPEGLRSAYAPVTYLEPATTDNRRLFGYDMYSETQRRVAMDLARDSGETALVSGIILRHDQGQEKQPGMLMYVPVYRRGAPLGTREERRGALRGFVYSPIRVKDFVFGTLGKLPVEVAFEIYHGETTQPEQLQFSSLKNGQAVLPANYQSALSENFVVSTYGQTWTFVFKSLPPFDREFGRPTLRATVVTGIIISLLISFITFSMQRTRDRALELARNMTQGLHESEEKTRLILDTAGAAIYGIDPYGLCTFCNPAGLRLLGYGSEAELLGRFMHDLIHHSHQDGSAYLREACPVDKVCQTLVGCHEEGEYFWKSDGTSFPVEYWALPQLKNGRLYGVVISFIDMSLRRQAEEALIFHQQKLISLNEALEQRVVEEVNKNRAKDRALMQNDKMASLGQLAAGVAHEINNPMSYILSNLEHMTQYLNRIVSFDTTLREFYGELVPATQEIVEKERKSLDIEYILTAGLELVTESIEGAGRVAKIVKDLKTFSRVGGEELQRIDLNSCLESALTIVHNELKYCATIHKEYGDLPEIMVNPNQLSQVFLNLLVNAGHALGDSGEIILRSWYDEEFVYASVSDTGQGIPEEIREKLFEPFFTTKEEGQGTGLGLSISSEIISKHRGKILVESEVGAGTTFTVVLPRVHGEM